MLQRQPRNGGPWVVHQSSVGEHVDPIALHQQLAPLEPFGNEPGRASDRLRGGVVHSVAEFEAIQPAVGEGPVGDGGGGSRRPTSAASSGESDASRARRGAADGPTSCSPDQFSIDLVDFHQQAIGGA